jgi:hypothetical protein
LNIRLNIRTKGDVFMEEKIMFGKILGEIYRIQSRKGYCYVGKGTVYGLLNGFESVIDEEIERIGHVTNEELRAVVNVLNEYHKDQSKFNALSGYYDIEDTLDELEISRSKAITILTYLYANRRFTDVIDKFDSQNSPTECRTFELDEWDK